MSLFLITGIIAIFFVVVGIALIVFYFAGLWKLFKKAGYEGWKAIIPFYSDWIMVEMVGLKWYWFIFLIAGSFVFYIEESSILVSIINIAAIIGDANVCYNLAKKCNKSTGWFVLSIFFSFITVPLLGFSKTDVFNKDVLVSENGFFDKDNVVPPNK